MPEFITVSPLKFGAWRPWKDRDRPSQELDVPQDFGLLGLYVLFASETAPSEPLDIGVLPAEVVYIGMSSRVDQRLEKFHRAVKTYKAKFSDPTCHRLWHATWHHGTSNWERDECKAVIAATEVAFYERALIAMYAAQHGRLPAINST
jgi:hypothetical protein